MPFFHIRVVGIGSGTAVSFQERGIARANSAVTAKIARSNL